MNETLQWVFEKKSQDGAKKSSRFTLSGAEKARRFHQSFPGYVPTPLVKLPALAETLGVSGLYVKDESKRFGLNAFKGLGGSYCLGRYIAEKLKVDIDDLPYDKMTSWEVKETLGEITFVTATDGNHGRGIAWTAHMLGQKAVVFMPKGSVRERLENIRKLGAQAEITELNYDQTVAYAAECEKKYGWVLVQDTAWEGYETIPGWIMEGYTTMALEAAEQLGAVKPTHIFLQAGVGAMSGALTGFFTDYYKNEEKPVITIVEPDQADCIFRTARAGDGKLHTVDGDMRTIMAGLACGVPCTIGWEELSRNAECFVSMPDWVAAQGMRILGNPMGDDSKVISGESGASAFGLVTELLRGQSKEAAALKEQLGITKDSRILCFSTEGDTDRENYRRIVWGGTYARG